MGAFVSDDEGSLFLEGGEFKVTEHVAELLAATLHAKGTHPVASLPATDSKRKAEVSHGGSFWLLESLNINHFHQESDSINRIYPRPGDLNHRRHILGTFAAGCRYDLNSGSGSDGDMGRRMELPATESPATLNQLRQISDHRLIETILIQNPVQQIFPMIKTRQLSHIDAG